MDEKMSRKEESKSIESVISMEVKVRGRKISKVFKDE
jgi:hypothetical protein